MTALTEWESFYVIVGHPFSKAIRLFGSIPHEPNATPPNNPNTGRGS